MAEKAWTPGYTAAEEAAIARLIKESGLSSDFVNWWLATSNVTAMAFLAQYGDKAGKQLQRIRQNEFVGKGYNAWQAERVTGKEPAAGAAAEAKAFGLTTTDPKTNPFGYLVEKLSQQTQIEAQVMGMSVSDYLAYLRAGGERPAGGTRLTETGEWETVAEADVSADAGAVAGEVADVFAPLTGEQLDELGAGQISEKFGLQRLAIEEPEAFLQAMFDKSGITPSPPIYGFLRDLMPSMVLLASTREGQDIMKSPGGAVELNRVINEIMSEGFPSRESVMGGLAGLGAQARPFLEQGAEATRTKFSYVMSTLNSLIGPTMSEPLRRALFNTQRAEIEGDRFLSAAARGVYQGDFIDWLRDQGYPIPALPAYTPTAGATEQAGATFVEAETGGKRTTATGAPAFVVEGGVYERE